MRADQINFIQALMEISQRVSKDIQFFKFLVTIDDHIASLNVNEIKLDNSWQFLIV